MSTVTMRKLLKYSVFFFFFDLFSLRAIDFRLVTLRKFIAKTDGVKRKHYETLLKHVEGGAASQSNESAETESEVELEEESEPEIEIQPLQKKRRSTLVSVNQSINQ